MKRKLTNLTLMFLLIAFSGYAQSKITKSEAKKVSKGEREKQDQAKLNNTDHIGTWKLATQKVTYENGQVLMSDSSSIFLRKILTPTNFVVIVERKAPEYDNKKLASSVSGGTYSLVDGDYQEFTKYAAFQGFETMKVNYKLKVEDGKLHTIGTVGGPTIYEEVYVRVDW